ncbi:hypothetical protein E2C01_081238 [Portunus trituberculatus]|uniref:Uncharacterized protein n=1 Tax=Portunus trituberculatus TaxID=210409 RepID=A0A5B7IRF0_PORTR|nr:hypothetical protein [Portunus trituberculatus]
MFLKDVVEVIKLLVFSEGVVEVIGVLKGCCGSYWCFKVVLWKLLVFSGGVVEVIGVLKWCCGSYWCFEKV